MLCAWLRRRRHISWPPYTQAQHCKRESIENEVIAYIYLWQRKSLMKEKFNTFIPFSEEGGGATIIVNQSSTLLKLGKIATPLEDCLLQHFLPRSWYSRATARNYSHTRVFHESEMKMCMDVFFLRLLTTLYDFIKLLWHSSYSLVACTKQCAHHISNSQLDYLWCERV